MRRFVYLLCVLPLPFLSQQASAQLEYRSIFGVQQSTLTPGNLFLGFTGDMANHLKIYDPTKGTYNTKPSTMVFNDVGLNSLIAYGLTSRVSLFTEIPLRSVHVYSLNPTLIGKGFGDIALGGSLNLVNDEKVSMLNITFSATLPVAADTPPQRGQYALGLHAMQFTLSVDGYHQVGSCGLLYSAYYNAVGNDGSLDYGDWTGTYLLLERYSQTPFGDFTFDAGLNAAYKFDDRVSGTSVKNSSDYYFNLLVGITYYYNPSLGFRVGVPYTVYQRNAWFTDYSVLLGVEYQFSL